MNMLSHLNYLHILVAALAYFVIGSLWYSLIFGKVWMKLNNFGTPTDADKKGMPLLFAMTFVYNFIISVGVAGVLYFVAPQDLLGAIKVGGFIAVTLTAVPIALNNMYTKKPFMLTIIDGGYHVAGIIGTTVILTLWH